MLKILLSWLQFKLHRLTWWIPQPTKTRGWGGKRWQQYRADESSPPMKIWSPWLPYKFKDSWALSKLGMNAWLICDIPQKWYQPMSTIMPSINSPGEKAWKGCGEPLPDSWTPGGSNNQLNHASDPRPNEVWFLSRLSLVARCCLAVLLNCDFSNSPISWT